jgi:enoyl-[acyl-carrier protein] reductase II
MFHTVICDLLGIRYPVLQGAMQGGGGVELVAAVSEAGGLGVLPTFGGTDGKLRADIAAMRARTRWPFGVNIMPMGRGITERCAGTCIELGVPIVTTGRADPGEAVVRRLKAAGLKVVSVIPTVEHARRMEAEGVDAVVASGAEAGGHVGTVSTLPLLTL